MAGSAFKQPVSVLVVIHTPSMRFLLLERVAPAGFWQSVTGSLEPGETPLQAAVRETAEETGILATPTMLRDWRHTYRFEIHPQWRIRYDPAVTHNVEHLFSLCVGEEPSVRIAPSEHRRHLWLPRLEAAEKVFSWTNRDAILRI